jgi:hypothetical protein
VTSSARQAGAHLSPGRESYPALTPLMKRSNWATL